MAKLVSKKTTTVTEEVEIVPATPGAEKGHHYLKVCGYGLVAPLRKPAETSLPESLRVWHLP